MSKEFSLIVVIIIVAMVGGFVLTKEKKNPGGSSPASSLNQPTNHVVGAGKKAVTLIEYGDFQCPACKSYFPIVKEIKDTYGDDITFQFRHYPLTQIHPNAMIGHRAAEAAGKQGKFFEMHDILYEEQDRWSKASDPTEILLTYARQLELNEEQFKADMKSEATAAAINADIKAGQAIGAESTPTFVINGKKLDPNPRSIEEFKQLIDEEIKKATGQI